MRVLVGGWQGNVLGYPAGEVSFGIIEICEVVAVMEAAVLFVIKVRCPLCAPLCERYAARSSHPVPGDGVRLDNLVGLEEFR